MKSATISYPLEKLKTHPSLDDDIRAVAKRHGWSGSDTGMGFGQRDLEFDVGDDWTAKQMWNVLGDANQHVSRIRCGDDVLGRM